MARLTKTPINMVQLAADDPRLSAVVELNAGQHGSWNEGPGGMLCNAHPTHGGIIDATIKTGEWFVVFNDDCLPTQDGFASRDEAIRAFLGTTQSAQANLR